METNTSSSTGSGASPSEAPAGPEVPAGLEGLAAVVDELAADDLDRLGDPLLAAQVLALERLNGQLAAVRLRRLAAVDARGAAGAERGVQFLSTTGWLRSQSRMSAAAAGRLVRTARALYRGPLQATAQALAAGEVSYAHAAVLADATHDLPPAKVREGESAVVDAARRLDPGWLRRLAAHLRDVVDPEGAEERARRRLDRRGLWVNGTFDGMVDVKGLLDPEGGEAVQAALAPLARPTGPDDERSGAQRRADALGELGRWALQAGDLPKEGGLRPNVNVTVDLASLRNQVGVGGVGGWGGVLPPETVRRQSCDAVVTRAIVRRHPTHLGPADAGGLGNTGADGNGERPGHASLAGDPAGGGLAERVRAAIPLLGPLLGAPVELLELGRGTRIIKPTLRKALALRDGGCVAPGCDRPPQWTDAHHVQHWIDGGATSLANLVLLCRTHHVAVHEGGWRLYRDPATNQVTLTPPTRRGHDPPAA